MTVEKALTGVRPRVGAVLREVAEYEDLNIGIEAMMARVNEFPSPLAALLSGVGVHEPARRYVDEEAGDLWGQPWVGDDFPQPEVVVGSGPHALIYAAIRSRMGVPIIVIERSERAGGSFACSAGPSFWLNSRNRPGPLGLPGQGEGLNVLPGCVLQPAMVGGGEYQTNADLAWTIRMNLLMLPGVKVHTGFAVTGIEPDEAGYRLTLSGDGSKEFIRARRVILATGLGEPKVYSNSLSQRPDRVLTFMEFMGKMDETFPLRGMRRVAVLGAGDSGKTAVETLLGQGPSRGMSVPALDFPTYIDWYGCPWPNQKQFCKENRGRYNRIGKALDDRVTPIAAKPQFYPSPGYESAQIGPVNYDWIIDCTGFREDRSSGSGGPYPSITRAQGQRVAIQSSTDEVYRVGPAANLPLSNLEKEFSGLQSIPENSASIFRYAPLTAALAATLPPVGVPTREQVVVSTGRFVNLSS